MATQTVSSPKMSQADTREKVVQAAAELFYLKGYQGTSLDSVANKAEVNRGSLYYFFRSKKKLALAVIDYFERLLHLHYLDPAFEGSENGREKLARLADLYSKMPSSSSPCCGCPIGKLSLELSGIDEDLRFKFKEVWEKVIGRIEEVVSQAVEEEMLPNDGDAKAFARAFFEQIQGAHLIARSLLDEEALQADCKSALQSLPWIE